ncbi:MAG: M14 family zinc carboxypeptidase [Bacteriovoracaceae bacterium]
MKLISVLFLTLFSTQIFAKAVIEEELYVFDQDQSFITHFASQKDLVIDHVSSTGYELYGAKGLQLWVTELGLKSINLKAMRNANKDNLEAYPSYSQIVKKLNELAQKKPEIVKLFSIGKTNQGKDLFFVKISDNVEQDEAEPEFKYVSSMHGDEITGRELMIRLIEDIINGYGTDASITKLVNNTEIFIMPSMNPDGSELKQRANAKGTDINRDFPDFSSADNQNNWLNRSVETQAMMKFQATRNFSLSANFHGGTQVVNYPWDTQKETFPLERLVRDLSIEYASTVEGMFNSSEFNQGVTNGFEWYEVDGGMQDWSYYWYGDLQLTIELSHMKYPEYSSIPTFYKQNKASLLRYISRIHQGAGFYFDFTKNGIVTVTRLDGGEKKIGTYRFSKQEFYKVLEIGQYRFDIEVEGTKKNFTVNVTKDVQDNKGNFIKL